MEDYNIPEKLKYTDSHEWILQEGNTITIGISDYAQKFLGDIVFVELPEKDKEYKKGDTLGVIESVKAAEDYFSPCDAKIIEVNNDIIDNPALVNEDCYSNGWFLKLETTVLIDTFMDAKQYKELLEKLKIEDE